MWRTVLGAVAGYVVIFVLVAVSLSLAWLALGAERAFAPGTTDVTPLWLMINLPVSFLAAVVGGIVATRIARGLRGAVALALLVLMLGLVQAVMVTTAPLDEIENPGELSTFEAAGAARQPTWYVWSLPILGLVGVLTGGLLVSRRAAPGVTEPT